MEGEKEEEEEEHVRDAICHLVFNLGSSEELYAACVFSFLFLLSGTSAFLKLPLSL